MKAPTVFLDEKLAKRLGCKVINTQPLTVTVVNGEKISRSACENFRWEMQGEMFVTDLRLFKLGGCDAMLGVDWMKTISPISFDFNELEVTITKDGKSIMLVGSLEAGSCKMMTGKRL